MSNLKNICATLLLALLVALPSVSPAGVIDRVVAYVDDRAITERELDTVHQRAISSGLRPTRAETLEKLINRILLVGEALKLRIEGANEDELVHEYIDLKVRAFITLRDSDVRQHYLENSWKYKGASYESIKDNIRQLLEEKEVNASLRRHLEKIREKADIRIMLAPDN